MTNPRSAMCWAGNFLSGGYGFDVLQETWRNAEDTKLDQDELHRLTNEVRKAGGLPLNLGYAIKKSYTNDKFRQHMTLDWCIMDTETLVKENNCSLVYP